MNEKEKKINGYENNKVRVCGFAVITNFIFFILACVAFTLPFLGTNDSFSLGVFVTLLIVLIIFFLLFVYSFITMWPVVIIDEKGMHKSLLGLFFKKSVLWEEIKCVRNIRTLGSVASWTVFSKSDISKMGISRCRLRRDNIYFMNSEKLQDLVKQFYDLEGLLIAKIK